MQGLKFLSLKKSDRMPHFTLLLYLLLGTLSCTFFSTLLSLKTRQRSTFDRVLLAGSVYLGFHAFYVFLVRAIFYDHLYLDRLAPFALLYGPLLFMVFAAVLKDGISRRTLFIHSFTAIIFWLGFILVLIIGVDTSIKKIYGYALTFAVPVSLLGYTAHGLYCTTFLKGKLRKYRILVIPALLLMFFMCAICIIVPFYRRELSSSRQARELLSIMVYALMLMASLLILKYWLYVSQKQKLKTSKEAENNASYQRSSMPKVQLEKYKDILEQLMSSEKTFLIPGVSLTDLSKILRLPKHQLTQVFTLAIGKTFSQYINSKRIEHACDLLLNQREKRMAEIALDSGFGTLISFHRQFKLTLGCTPAEYRKKFPA